MTDKAKAHYETITRVRQTSVRAEGSEVLIVLHCGDAYGAQVLAEDLQDRMKTQRLMVQFGKANSVKAKLS